MWIYICMGALEINIVKLCWAWQLHVLILYISLIRCNRLTRKRHGLMALGDIVAFVKAISYLHSVGRCTFFYCMYSTSLKIWHNLNLAQDMIRTRIAVLNLCVNEPREVGEVVDGVVHWPFGRLSYRWVLCCRYCEAVGAFRNWIVTHLTKASQPPSIHPFA